MAVPFAFRIISGLLFIYFGYSAIAKNRAEKISAVESFKLKPGGFWLRVIALIEIIGGILLFVGFLTQIASLVLSVILLIGTIAKRKNPAVFSFSAGFLFLLLIITLSLLFLGPGLYSIDLPF